MAFRLLNAKKNTVLVARKKKFKTALIIRRKKGIFKNTQIKFGVKYRSNIM